VRGAQADIGAELSEGFGEKDPYAVQARICGIEQAIIEMIDLEFQGRRKLMKVSMKHSISREMLGEISLCNKEPTATVCPPFKPCWTKSLPPPIGSVIVPSCGTIRLFDR